MAMEREEKTFLRAMAYVLIAFVLMVWALWLLSPKQAAQAVAPGSAAERRGAPATAAARVAIEPDSAPSQVVEGPADPIIVRTMAQLPLVENGFEVVGPTVRKPSNPAPGQRYLDTDLNTYSIYNGTSWLSVNTSAGVGVLDDIGDVDVGGPATGEFLGWDGAAWSNQTVSMSELDDVDLTGISDNQYLSYASATSTWVPVSLSTDDLSNFNLTSLQDEQFIRYDAGTNKLINETVDIQTDLGYFVVTDYGAIQDDATDDTTAIQEAIDAAEAYTSSNAESHAQVYFPRGKYNFTTLTIDGANIELVGWDARLEQILGTGYNQAIYVKGEVDSGDAEDVTFRGLTVDCNYPSIDSAGSGIGFNIRADNVTLDHVTCENTEDGTFISAFCLYTTYDHCISRNAGRSGFRPRGDFQKLIHCEAYDWNAVNAASGNRAILADGQEIDAYELFVDDFYAHMSVARPISDCILVDCGDGELDGTNDVPCGNSGQATQVNGKAAWTINAGHGFAPGDGIKIQESGVSAYDSESSTDGMMHKITSVTGEVFVYVVDANTLKLYKTAADAKLNAGSSTNRYDLTNSGTGTFYIKSFGGRRRQFTVASTTDDTITCTGHGFHTGREARLTVAVEGTDVLPAGLANVALIATNTDYTVAGTNARYWRNKRVKDVTLRNVRIQKEAPTASDSAVIKVNNTDNLLIDRFVAMQTPWDSAGDHDDQCLRFGAGNRKITVLNSIIPNGIVNNTRSYIPELEVAHCEIGTQAYIPVDAVSTLQVSKFHFHDNKVRFSHAALQTATTVLEMRDSDIDGWNIHDNSFEGHSTTTARIIDVQNVEHLRKSGLVRFWNNTRRNAGTSTAPYGGLSFTASTSDTITASGHCLMTGDEVYVATTGTLPTGLTANTKYFVRRTGDSTLTLHTNLPGATDNTNLVDITSAAGSGTHTIHGPRNVGIGLTFATPRDRGWIQKGSSGKEFFSPDVPANVNFEWQLGDIVWQMNPVTGQSPGWICTKTGVGGTTAATFKSLPAIGNGVLLATSTAAGNVGTGEDDLISYTLASGIPGATGDTFTVEAKFVIANTARTKRIRGYCGGTLVYDSGAHVHTNGGDVMVRLSGIYTATGVALVSADVNANLPASDAIEQGSPPSVGVALAAGGIIKFTGDVSVGASNDEISQIYMTMQYNPSP